MMKLFKSLGLMTLMRWGRAAKHVGVQVLWETPSKNAPPSFEDVGM